jgi:hypothetical protein
MITLHETVRAHRLVMLLVVLALAGCGLRPSDKPSASPSPLPGDRLVFMVVGGLGGFTPYFHQVLITPSLAVYGDGRVIRYAEGNQAPDVPAAYVVSQVDPAQVAAFVADAESRNLIDEQTDFGSPGVTDMPSTTVRLHGASGLHEVHVYAFGRGFDDHLPRAQRKARKELAEVIDRATGLSGDGERLPYRPDRVRVAEFSDGGSGTPAPWPGPDPKSFLVPNNRDSILVACGELLGQPAEKAYDAARANPGGMWTWNSNRRVLAVAPVLPGLLGCR